MEAQRPQITVSTTERNHSDDLAVRHPRVTRLAIRNITPRYRNVSAGSTCSNMPSQTESHADGASDSITSLATDHTVARDNSAPSTSGASITTGNSAVDSTPVAQYATVRSDAQVTQVSPVRAHSPRVLALAAIASPLRLADGSVIHHEILLSMADQLEAARIENRFPNTTTSYRNAQAVFDDFEQLQALRSHVSGTQEHNTLYVENARRIQERDAQVVHGNRDAHVRHTVQGLLRNQDVGEDLHAIVRQAARVASANAIERALARQDQQVDRSTLVRDVSQAIIRAMAEQELVGVQAVQNVDDILEDMFGVVENGILDATGPLRLNVNRLGNIDNNLRVESNNLRSQNGALGNHLNNLTTQVGAMNTHVGAVGTHVNALGTLMQVMNDNTARTNSQVGQFSNEINNLQQITAMLPALIQELVQQILPGAVQAALTQALAGALQGANGKSSIIATAQAMAVAEKLPIISEKEIKVTKKTKKRGFFSRLFKRGGGKKDGDTGSAC